MSSSAVRLKDSGAGRKQERDDMHTRTVSWTSIVCRDCAVREIEDALQVVERSGDDLALALAGMTLGFALVHGSVNAQAAVLHFMT
jgi:NaMN:DMB phosphoribosyltransferase